MSNTGISGMLSAIERLEEKAWSDAARAAALLARRAHMKPQEEPHPRTREPQEARVRRPRSTPSGREGHGYGHVLSRMVERGDHPKHPLPEGREFGAGDPRNDPAYRRYAAKVDKRTKAAVAAGRETSKLFGARKNGELTGAYTASRRAEHEKIIDNIMEAHKDVPDDQQAIMLGGLPGAGKSTFLRDHGEGLGGFLHVKTDENGDTVPTNAIVINPDEMKSLLLNREDAKGRPLVPRTPGLTDGEHAALVHEESSHLAAMLAQRAMAEGKNVVFDITLGDANKANTKYITNKNGTGAKDLGYTVHHAFIDGDMATSLHRAGLRHKAVNKETGERTFSGRYVDYGHLLHEANTAGALDSDGNVAESKNRVESDKMIKSGVFDSVVRHDNKTGETTTVKAPSAAGAKSLLSDILDAAHSVTLTMRK
jgi:hypothetical protein